MKEKRQRGGGGVGGGGVRAIIIINKSMQIKVVPLYSQVWTSKVILRPCPFSSTAENTGTDTRQKFLSILLHLHSFHFQT